MYVDSPIQKKKFRDCCDAQGVDSYVINANDIRSGVSVAPNIYEDQSCTKGIIVEAFVSNDFSCFHDDMMSQKNFQDLLNEEKHEPSATSLEFYQSPLYFYEYADDIEKQYSDMSDVAETFQLVHEDIPPIIHE